MKTFTKQFCVTVIFMLSASFSFSTPLNGTYTIGSGGNYPTINSAFSDAYTEGINGPVIFEVISGTYNEEVVINFFFGSSSVNTVTMRSQSGNPDDVIINGDINVFNIYSSNLIIDKITIGSSATSVDIHGVNITFSNNKFNNGSLVSSSYYDLFHIFLTGNENIGNIEFRGGDISETIQDIQILNNTITGNISLQNCIDSRIENNTIDNGITLAYYSGYIVKNKITGGLDNPGPPSVSYYNNFILGNVRLFFSDFANNTVVGGTLTTPTISNFVGGLTNNLIINPMGGTTLTSVYTLNSDYNNYYNGNNNSLVIIQSTSYNNLLDLYNATGSEQHSISKPVNFQSPTDLHLALSSLGDLQLAGIPHPSVIDDIDGQTRSFTNPYKGADEVIDYPLPVELSSFTSTVNKNNVNLNWTTASETNNSGFDIERSNVNGQTSNNWLKIGSIQGHGTVSSPNNYEFTDRNLASGKYNYRLKQIDFNGNYEYYNLSDEVVIGVPEKFSLEQNYPNPFNPSTVIRYSLSENSFVTLKVYDIVGNEVVTLVNENQNSGTYNYQFSAVNYQLSSGVYFYKIEAGSFSSIKRMILLK